MGNTIQIRCKYNGEIRQVPIGCKLTEVFRLLGLEMEYGPICARVNNKVEGMNYQVFRNKDVEFLDLTYPSASRVYSRTLFFVLCKAVHDLYPNGSDQQWLLL